MSRRAEIFQRFQVEFQEASRRGREMHDEVLRQEQDVLATNVPAAKAALARYADELAAALAAHDETLQESEAELAEEEFKAIDAQQPALDAVDQAFRDANDRAFTKREAAREQAEEEFDAAFRAAQQLIGAPADKAIANARKRRDAAHANADQGFLDDTDAAFRTHQDAANAVRETAIATIDRLRQEQAKEADAAAAALAKDREAAEARLMTVINTEPTAAAIHEAFRLRLDEVDRQAEMEKQAILARMRAELDQAGG